MKKKKNSTQKKRKRKEKYTYTGPNGRGKERRQEIGKDNEIQKQGWRENLRDGIQ